MWIMRMAQRHDFSCCGEHDGSPLSPSLSRHNDTAPMMIQANCVIAAGTRKQQLIHALNFSLNNPTKMASKIMPTSMNPMIPSHINHSAGRIKRSLWQSFVLSSKYLCPMTSSAILILRTNVNSKPTQQRPIANMPAGTRVRTPSPRPGLRST